jgi:AraC-like DNA-binding protein
VRAVRVAHFTRRLWHECRVAVTKKRSRRWERDTYVARALALLDREIARAWTVDELGREVGLSRSALADRFIRLIGTPPMHYLANWRMQVATEKLRNSSASLAQVAEMIGYESEAAFSHAFKKAVGAAPATWRRSHR